MNSFEILGQKKVLTAHAFDVLKVRFRLPDGREHAYDLVDHPDAVTLLPITEAGEVILVSQYRIGAQGFLLELPAGVMDPGETPLESARRELREETGQDSDLLIPLGGFYMVPGYSNEYMSAFLALGLHPAPLAQDEDEFLELKRLPLGEAYRLLWTGQLQDGKTIATLMLALPELLQHFPDMKDTLFSWFSGNTDRANV
jgi:ADP-ribose pyrophosphatase